MMKLMYKSQLYNIFFENCGVCSILTLFVYNNLSTVGQQIWKKLVHAFDSSVQCELDNIVNGRKISQKFNRYNSQ